MQALNGFCRYGLAFAQNSKRCYTAASLSQTPSTHIPNATAGCGIINFLMGNTGCKAYIFKSLSKQCIANTQQSFKQEVEIKRK
jgi:hypothetical protein